MHQSLLSQVFRDLLCFSSCCGLAWWFRYTVHPWYRICVRKLTTPYSRSELIRKPTRILKIVLVLSRDLSFLPLLVSCLTPVPPWVLSRAPFSQSADKAVIPQLTGSQPEPGNLTCAVLWCTVPFWIVLQKVSHLHFSSLDEDRYYNATFLVTNVEYDSQYEKQTTEDFRHLSEEVETMVSCFSVCACPMVKSLWLIGNRGDCASSLCHLPFKPCYSELKMHCWLCTSRW